MTNMDSTDYFKNRRTIRKYSGREVSDSLINDMLKAAMQAPTTGNMQLYSVVVTRSEEGKRSLAPGSLQSAFGHGCFGRAHFLC